MKTIVMTIALLLAGDLQAHAQPQARAKSDRPISVPSFFAKWHKKSVDIFVVSDSADLYAATEQAIAQINGALGFPLLRLKGTRAFERREYRGRNQINSIVEIPDELYPKFAGRDKKSLAVTKLVGSRGRLWEADVLIRSSTVKGRYLRATILHELGHVIGYGHTKDVRSIMYPELRDARRITLSDVDTKILRSRYLF